MKKIKASSNFGRLMMSDFIGKKNWENYGEMWFIV
jgi:hypothetical protein